ncbi:MAG: extracellular solute-binding protein [Anaerolineae bacterium]|nr:extracellular solute-binding protein [Anaerolineae bacterium]
MTSAISGLLSLLATGLMLVSCGQEGLPSPSPAGPTPTVTVPIEMPVVISIAGALDDQTLGVLDEQIAAFEAANPDVLVEVVVPEGNSTFPEEAAAFLAEGDTSRDIYVVPTTWLPALAAGGGLLALDPYVERAGLDLARFFPAAAAAAVYDNVVVALPWTVDGGLLYYRRDVLNGLGLAPPETWKDLAEIARQAAGGEELPYGFVWQGAAYDGLTCNTLEFVWAAGGQVLDAAGQPGFDTPATVDGLRLMLALIEWGASPPEVTTFREAAALTAFGEGDALFMRNWTYAWQRLQAAGSSVAGKVGVAPLPASCLGGQVLVLSTSSQHPDETFRFMAFLVEYDQQAQLALGAVQPPALMTIYSDETLLAQAPILTDLYQGLLAIRPRPQSADYAAISEVIYTEVNGMLRGLQSPDATAATVDQALKMVVGGRH